MWKTRVAMNWLRMVRTIKLKGKVPDDNGLQSIFERMLGKQMLAHRGEKNFGILGYLFACSKNSL
jgi:hypothetical protein